MKTNQIKLQEIVRRGYCLGCGMCVSVLGKDKVQIVENNQGFMVAEVLSESDVCYQRNLCPGITVNSKKEKKGIAGQIYGSYEKLVAGYACDPVIRQKASSGGVITAVVCYLFDSGKIDGVLHVGKDPHDPVRSSSCYSQSKREIIERSGSRYAPASLFCDLGEILLKGCRVAIVGKPCDIAAVRQFLDANPIYRNQIVCTMSFMCMGMPSYKGTYTLIEQLGCSQKNVKDFWYRGNGWPGDATVIDKNGDVYSCSYEDSWGKILNKLINFRCKICPDGYGEFADISCGDAWYLKEGRPCFEEKKGRSVVFVRTSLGEVIYENALRDGYINDEVFDVETLRLIQSSQYYRKSVVGARILALKLCGDTLIQFKGFDFISNSRFVGYRESLKNMLGMWERMLRRKE